MASFEQGVHVNRVVLYGDLAAVISGGATAGWKARQVTITVRNWAVTEGGKSPDYRVPLHIALRFTNLTT